MGWLCDYFRVLPSDPLLWELTEEQLDHLALQVEHLHPPRDGEQEYHDPDYEEWVRAVETEDDGIWWEELPAGGQEPQEAPEGEVRLDTFAGDGEWEEIGE